MPPAQPDKQNRAALKITIATKANTFFLERFDPPRTIPKKQRPGRFIACARSECREERVAAARDDDPDVGIPSVTVTEFDPGVTVEEESWQVELLGKPAQASLTGFVKEPSRGAIVNVYEAGLPA